jgi:hypothetical protein
MNKRVSIFVEKLYEAERRMNGTKRGKIGSNTNLDKPISHKRIQKTDLV